MYRGHVVIDLEDDGHHHRCVWFWTVVVVSSQILRYSGPLAVAHLSRLRGEWRPGDVQAKNRADVARYNCHRSDEHRYTLFCVDGFQTHSVSRRVWVFTWLVQQTQSLEDVLLTIRCMLAALGSSWKLEARAARSTQRWVSHRTEKSS